jgi:hypothetical protein
MFGNNCSNLTGVDIFAAGDNHVLQAVQNVAIASGILIANVTSAKHPVVKRKLNIFWIAPVTPHDVRTRLPGINWLSRRVDNLDIDSKTRPSTRQKPTVNMLVVPAGR